ncbi:SGNH/GDSL hydrolase family protein [Pseudomonas sp. Marseille-QA0892]
MPLVIFGLAMLAASAAQARDYSSLIVFGDSYSDSGASHAISVRRINEGVFGAERVPSPLFWEGRWSNGPTAVEVLASRLGLELENHAVGGAMSGTGNANPSMDTFGGTGMLSQINVFREKKGRLDPDALYVLFATTNDFLAAPTWPSDDVVLATADAAVANQLQAIEQLRQGGAAHIVLVGPIDLAQVPMVVRAGLAGQAVLFRDRVNDGLKRLLSERNAGDILYFDHIAFSTPIMSAPNHYGFENVTQSCIRSTAEGDQHVCRRPDTYYFYDEVHPTARVHRLAGEALTEAVRGWRR